MTQQKQIWKCEVCGNIIEVLHEGADSLVCCGQPMNEQKENVTDPEKGEKHIPVIDGNKVIVGSVAHPMEESHYIEWIEASGENGEIAKVFLSPGDKPEAEFCFAVESAREYCNLHGLWKK